MRGHAQKRSQGSGDDHCALGGEARPTVCDREEVGRTALPACAQPSEHWENKPAARRADKQITGFTVDASSKNFATCAKYELGESLHLVTGPRALRTPRLVTTCR